MPRLGRSITVLVLLFVFAALPAAAQPIHVPIETAAQDKAFSEFNHHLAGWFLLSIGILAFLGGIRPELTALTRVWPFLFLFAGLYLAFMSDPGVWPMGRQGWVEAFRSNPEAAQHKIYALLLLALGVIELQRSRGKLHGLLALWAFPALALFGAVLLFFHPHGSGAHDMAGSMPGMHHSGHAMTESMRTVQREHFWFSITGFGVVLFKFLADGRFWNKPFLPYLWPACISALGVLLILYHE
jgi:hypothetical protein